MSTPRELLPVELLVRADERIDDHTRRVTIADHERFRRDLAAQQSAQQAQPDPIDDELDDGLVTDPLIERIGRGRKQSEARRVLAILDQIGRTDG